IATAEKEKYIAFVENWRQSQVELARFETDKALKALQGQTDLGLKSIVEAGETKRWALTTDLIWSVILIVGLVFLGWYFLKKQGQPQVIQVLSAPPNTPMLPNGNRAQLPGYRAQLPGRTQNVEQEITHYYDQYKSYNPDDLRRYLDRVYDLLYRYPRQRRPARRLPNAGGV
ncbi:MAG: hypothetical protein KDE31_13615, partial [Caldilineaceae bacterium]|nr:hypothetical protein [Caldilineaceae bacterium]